MKWKDNNIKIKEQSFWAKIAAKKLGSDSVALVLGDTIHLHNISKNEFLKNERWVKHELCHVQQYQQYGYTRFVLKYLWESICKGY